MSSVVKVLLADLRPNSNHKQRIRDLSSTSLYRSRNMAILVFTWCLPQGEVITLIRRLRLVQRIELNHHGSPGNRSRSEPERQTSL